MKKVVICASYHFQNEFEHWKQKLESGGYEVILYPQEIKGDFLRTYPQVYKEHYEKISQTDILFVLNLDKNGVSNYIGPSVFAEISHAIGLNVAQNKNIEIYCLNPLPKDLVYSCELELWGKLGWIKHGELK